LSEALVAEDEREDGPGQSDGDDDVEEVNDLLYLESGDDLQFGVGLFVKPVRVVERGGVVEEGGVVKLVVVVVVRIVGSGNGVGVGRGGCHG